MDVSLDGGKEGYFIHPYGLVETGRAYFPFVNASLLSFYLSCFFFVVLYFFVKEKGKLGVWIYGTLIFLVPIAIVFTKSRAAIGVVFFLFFFFLLYYFKNKKQFQCTSKPLIIILLYLFFLTFFVFIFHQYSFVDIITDIRETQEEQSIVEGEEEQSLIEIEIQKKQALLVDQYTSDAHNRRNNYHWPTALVLFEQHPFFGVGTGTYYYSVLYGEKEALCSTVTLCPDIIQPTDRSSTAHSIYLQILAENGIIGVSAFLAFLLLLLYTTYKEIKKKQEMLFFTLIFTAIAIQGIFFSYFEYPEMWYLFLVFVGISMKKGEKENI